MPEIYIDDHIKLRPFQKGDEYSISEQANNIKIWNNMQDAMPYPYTLEMGQRWVDYNVQEDAQQRPEKNFAIEVDKKAVGAIGCMLKKGNERKCGVIGYWLGEAFWFKGIMTKCIHIFSHYCFEQYGLIRLEAPVFAFNQGSMRALEKAGFHKEHVRKFAYIKNDTFADAHVYVMLKPGIEL
ncbi:MAG: GNAT family N-acetyltransferase [Chitinophagales bacterium]|nr:GNAT family N-acetyltransferase [Chitinophagales bacterium]